MKKSQHIGDKIPPAFSKSQLGSGFLPLGELTLPGATDESLETHAALMATDRAIFRWNLQEGGLQWSDNIHQLLPFASALHLAREQGWLTLIHPDDRLRFAQMKQTLLEKPGRFSIDYRLNAEGGKIYRIRQSGNVALPEDGHAMVASGMVDIDTIPPAAMHMSSIDVNRPDYHYPEKFLGLLQDIIDRTIINNRNGVLLVISINNLAMVINSYGHDTSELVVEGLLSTIQNAMPPGSVVKRIGRELIGIVLAPCESHESLVQVNSINTLVHGYGCNSPFGALHVTCSVVGVDFPGTTTSATDALDKSYIALNRNDGVFYRTFEDVKGEVAQFRQQMGLANYLRRAIEENRLRLAYQPIIEAKTGRIVHYEALLRLVGEDGKISTGGALIPIAERMGLIHMIDMQVLDMVIKELVEAPDITLALNVSNLTTDNAEWLAHFNQLIKEHPAVATRLIVEITETAAHRDLQQTAMFVASLQAVGCQVALDDFGSGYTSFRQLKALSVDMVKIDGAFIRDLVDNADNRFFVKTLLEFTNGFGLKAVAEYVESGEIAKMLMELGVEYMQGYYFGRPENHRSWLK